VRASIALVLLLSTSVGLSGAQCVPSARSPRIETFASITTVTGPGETGSELRLEETGGRVSAVLRDYLGDGKLMETKLSGALTTTSAGGCRVHLSGENKDGQVEIDGEIEVARFYGTAKRHVGKQVFSHMISLKRKLPRVTPELGFPGYEARLGLIGRDASDQVPHPQVVSGKCDGDPGDFLS
jgi:hypothetical protein